MKSSSTNLPKWRRRRYIVESAESEYEDRGFLSSSFWSISNFFHRLFGLFWNTFSPWTFATKVGKKIKLWHQSTKIPFWGCHNHYGFSSGEFHWRPCTEFCPGFETMNESVNARTSGCKFMTSARIIFFFFNSYSKPYNKQLNNLDRSVVAGKSQTSAYRIDLAIARSIRQGLGLRFSRNDLTLGY